MATEPTKYHLTRACLDILRGPLASPDAYKEHPKASALMVAAYEIQENQISQYPQAKGNEQDIEVDLTLTEAETDAVEAALTMMVDNARLNPSPHSARLVSLFLNSKVENKEEKLIDFSLTVGGVALIKQALTAMVIVDRRTAFCWYKDESDKAIALLRSQSIVECLPDGINHVPEPEAGESQDAYDKRIAPITGAESTVTLTRSNADIVTKALKTWLKSGLLPVNKHTVKLIKEFSL